ncbi:putative signal peptide protein [Puccinia sorghi]|uniref:Putative signal peptide protein n=1 Tax=Puccinia sorghi TaxID=27349 RepID=A0A0L6URF9_9BASI|nr:putative signal peptide protein [Puccinia sorghi]
MLQMLLIIVCVCACVSLFFWEAYSAVTNYMNSFSPSTVSYTKVIYFRLQMGWGLQGTHTVHQVLVIIILLRLTGTLLLSHLSSTWLFRVSTMPFGSIREKKMICPHCSIPYYNYNILYIMYSSLTSWYGGCSYSGCLFFLSDSNLFKKGIKYKKFTIRNQLFVKNKHILKRQFGLLSAIKQPKMAKLDSSKIQNYDSYVENCSQHNYDCIRVSMLILEKTLQKRPFSVNCGSLSAIKQPKKVKLNSSKIQNYYSYVCKHVNFGKNTPKKAIFGKLWLSKIMIHMWGILFHILNFDCSSVRIEITLSKIVKFNFITMAILGLFLPKLTWLHCCNQNYKCGKGFSTYAPGPINDHQMTTSEILVKMAFLGSKLLQRPVNSQNYNGVLKSLNKFESDRKKTQPLYEQWLHDATSITIQHGLHSFDLDYSTCYSCCLQQWIKGTAYVQFLCCTKPETTGFIRMGTMQRLTKPASFPQHGPIQQIFAQHSNQELSTPLHCAQVINKSILWIRSQHNSNITKKKKSLLNVYESSHTFEGNKLKFIPFSGVSIIIHTHDSPWEFETYHKIVGILAVDYQALSLSQLNRNIQTAYWLSRSNSAFQPALDSFPSSVPLTSLPAILTIPTYLALCFKKILLLPNLTQQLQILINLVRKEDISSSGFLSCTVINSIFISLSTSCLTLIVSLSMLHVSFLLSFNFLSPFLLNLCNHPPTPNMKCMDLGFTDPFPQEIINFNQKEDSKYAISPPLKEVSIANWGMYKGSEATDNPPVGETPGKSWRGVTRS